MAIKQLTLMMNSTIVFLLGYAILRGDNLGTLNSMSHLAVVGMIAFGVLGVGISLYDVIKFVRGSKKQKPEVLGGKG